MLHKDQEYIHSYFLFHNYMLGCGVHVEVVIFGALHHITLS